MGAGRGRLSPAHPPALGERRLAELDIEDLADWQDGLEALMEMTGCRPGEALAMRWEDVGEQIAIVRRLSGDVIVDGTKGGRERLVPALRRVEEGWRAWREALADPGEVRESVTGLVKTRPYDLGRHTHSALMLASGMSLQQLAASASSMSPAPSNWLSSKTAPGPSTPWTRSKPLVG